MRNLQEAELNLEATRARAAEAGSARELARAAVSAAADALADAHRALVDDPSDEAAVLENDCTDRLRRARVVDEHAVATRATAERERVAAEAEVASIQRTEEIARLTKLSSPESFGTDVAEAARALVAAMAAVRTQATAIDERYRAANDAAMQLTKMGVHTQSLDATHLVIAYIAARADDVEFVSQRLAELLQQLGASPNAGMAPLVSGFRMLEGHGQASAGRPFRENPATLHRTLELFGRARTWAEAMQAVRREYIGSRRYGDLLTAIGTHPDARA